MNEPQKAPQDETPESEPLQPQHAGFWNFFWTCLFFIGSLFFMARLYINYEFLTGNIAMPENAPLELAQIITHPILSVAGNAGFVLLLSLLMYTRARLLWRGDANPATRGDLILMQLMGIGAISGSVCVSLLIIESLRMTGGPFLGVLYLIITTLLLWRGCVSMTATLPLIKNAPHEDAPPTE